MDIKVIIEQIKMMSEDDLKSIRLSINDELTHRLSNIFKPRLDAIKKMIYDYKMSLSDDELNSDEEHEPNEDQIRIILEIDKRIIKFSEDLVDSEYLTNVCTIYEIDNESIDNFIDGYERYQDIDVSVIINCLIIEIKFDYVYLSDIENKLNIIEYIYNNNLGRVIRD